MNILDKYQHYLNNVSENNSFWFLETNVSGINELLSYGYIDLFDKILSVCKFQDLLKLGIKIPVSVLYNSGYIDDCIDTFMIDNYRRKIDCFYKYDIAIYDIIRSKMNKRYDNFLNHINADGILMEFKECYNAFINNDFSDVSKNALYSYLIRDFNDLKFFNYKDREVSLLRSKTDSFLLSCIADKYFDEYKKNLLINIKSILELNQCEVIIPKERLIIYKKILDFYNLSVSEKKELYFSLDLKYKDYLYDDFRRCRNYLYDSYNKEFFNGLNTKKSIINDVCVYELCGEDFYIPIHMTGKTRERCLVENLWSDKIEYLSLSVISGDKLLTYQDLEKYVGFGFFNVPKENIWHVCPWDSYSSGNSTVHNINYLYALKDLIKNTKAYNEIVVLEKDNILMPDYLVCCDEIISIDYEIAKKFNIPIVLIHSNKYKGLINNGIYSGGFLPDRDKIYVY